MTGRYDVEGKSLLIALDRCTGVIALGEKADANVITLDFHKKGLRIGAQNSVATYIEDVPVTVQSAERMRVSIVPNMLLSYAKSYKVLTLQPLQDHVIITSKGFEAKMHYIGEATPIDMVKPDASLNINPIAKVAREVLSQVSGIKNRTDSNPLGVKLEWKDGQMAISVGDSHHAVLVESKIKQKDSNSITTTLANLQKLMDIGNEFALENDAFYAWSDTEYLSLSTRVENMLSVNVSEILEKDKKKLDLTLSTESFKSMISTLTGAVDDTDIMRFVCSKGKLLATIKTAGGSAKAAIKIDNQKGKDADVKIAVHHLLDCLSPIKEKKFHFQLMGDSMIFFETKTESSHVRSVASVMGSTA